MPSQKEKKGLKRLLIEKEEAVRQKAVTEIAGAECICVQGLRDILCFSPEEIRILTISDIQRICGEELAITILTQDSIEIRGKIAMLIFANGTMEETP